MYKVSRVVMLLMLTVVLGACADGRIKVYLNEDGSGE
jgi:hypothetical protein